ncbi:MAG: CTP synthase [Candidatus Aenigmarchaeota archaeon]|nr:CTP synthase [Candidatus Aenigmarchaeota archaeon]
MPDGKTRFLIVTGGVISGLGKGVATASIGNVLQAQGYKVSIVKIDPYINIDAGTMRPTEHGEVFVTGDGGETDQDIGTYERFLDQDVSRLHNITTGQVYRRVIEMERNLEFGGRCVEVIPHIPQEVERRLKAVAQGLDFLLVEVGGTVGDYQNVLFLEAFRAMHLRGDPIAFIHVVYLPIPGNLGEMKTKPAQHSVRLLNETGIQPTFIIARASRPVDDVRKEKISIFCNVRKDHVIADPDTPSVYEMPLVFERQGFTRKILEHFNLPYQEGKMQPWEGVVRTIAQAQRQVRIGIVGKYFDIGDFTLEDSYLSVIEAIKHASWQQGAKPRIQWIDSKEFERDSSRLRSLEEYDGIIVPGGFGSSGVEGKIGAIRHCREQGIPYLGLCYGMQLAVVEYARNACGLEGANTTETGPAPHPVIDVLPEQAQLLAAKNYGNTMRLGNCTAVLAPGTLVHRLYGRDRVVERHRHRYEVNPAYIPQLEAKGAIFSGRSPDRRLMEFFELKGHPFFVGTQAHPELLSRPQRPHPLFLGFIQAALARQQPAARRVPAAA